MSETASDDPYNKNCRFLTEEEDCNRSWADEGTDFLKKCILSKDVSDLNVNEDASRRLQTMPFCLTKGNVARRVWGNPTEPKSLGEFQQFMHELDTRDYKFNKCLFDGILLNEGKKEEINFIDFKNNLNDLLYTCTPSKPSKL